MKNTGDANVNATASTENNNESSDRETGATCNNNISIQELEQRILIKSQMDHFECIKYIDQITEEASEYIQLMS